MIPKSVEKEEGRETGKGRHYRCVNEQVTQSHRDPLRNCRTYLRIVSSSGKNVGLFTHQLLLLVGLRVLRVALTPWHT